MNSKETQTLQTNNVGYRKMFNSALDRQDQKDGLGSTYANHLDYTHTSPDRDLVTRKQQASIDFSGTTTDRTLKFKGETPFQKWMKLQGGHPGALCTTEPDNMMKQMSNGPILREELNRTTV